MQNVPLVFSLDKTVALRSGPSCNGNFPVVYCKNALEVGTDFDV